LLTGNGLGGVIPQSLVTVEGLQVLRLGSNSLIGPFPDDFVSLTDLVILDVSNNFMSGNIPAGIGQMAQLLEIRLNTNSFEDNEAFGFTGPIPASLALCRNLQRLDLYDNRLEGEIPQQIGFINSLEVLNLSSNSGIGGAIPDSFINLVNLKEFYTAGTSLEGVVPDALCEFNTFVEVDCVNDGDLQCDCCTCA